MESFRNSAPDFSLAKLDIFLVLFLSSILFLTALGARDLWNPNEAIYGRAVAEMEQRGDWLIPTVNDLIFAEKPILYYWGALTAVEIFGGVDEFSLRVPSVVAGVLSALLTYLLVLPYAGRRRALLAAALLVTCYQMFWASRAVQMDILVLASTLGVLLPLTRMLDFDAAPVRMWCFAGTAAGLGFAAKGPVAWVIPATVFICYVIASQRSRQLWRPQILIGAVTAIFVGSPWYLTLWSQGETSFLYETLIRQNFGRFFSAWDHQQPWWYFIKYLMLDYSPWSFLLPAVFLVRAKSDSEECLHRLSWCWIIGVIFFFSLSDSKRAPYILPVAPAVAILASAVFLRFTQRRLSPSAERAAIGGMAFLALVFLATGPAVFFYAGKIPEQLTALAPVLAALMTCIGLAVCGGIFLRRQIPEFAPFSLLAGTTVLYLFIAVLVFPAMNPLKSARGFAERLEEVLENNTEVALASYKFLNWRAGYSYYTDRNIRLLQSPEELETFWSENPTAYLIVESPNDEEVRRITSTPSPLFTRKIGGRTAHFFVKEGHP